MRKKLGYLAAACLIIYAVYFDLTAGTLPKSGTPAQNDAVHEVAGSGLSYTEQEVQPGDTLLSIMEQQSGKIARPVDQLIADFKSLNKDTSPQNLQIGKTYKFPLYEEVSGE